MTLYLLEEVAAGAADARTRVRCAKRFWRSTIALPYIAYACPTHQALHCAAASSFCSFPQIGGTPFQLAIEGKSPKEVVEGLQAHLKRWGGHFEVSCK